MRKIVLALPLFILMWTCSENNTEPKNIVSGYVISQSDCKSSKSSGFDNSESCIQYNYDKSNKTLFLTHINAGFNCCPGEISCDIDLNNSIISVAEKEEAAICNCNCLFDISIEINNVEKTAYIIKIIEPYIGDQDPLEFNINLISNISGEFCVERNSYPWGI